MLSYYFDHQVPEAVAIGLRERSVDVLTAREDGTEEWEDRDILERATILDRVVFTMDDDLLSIADEWVEQQREFGAWSTLTSCASAPDKQSGTSSCWHTPFLQTKSATASYSSRSDGAWFVVIVDRRSIADSSINPQP
jgi:hypothetical protein